MVKNKELKKRAIYVYPPSEMAEKWKKTASKASTSISKFVIEHVENSINLTEDDLRTKSKIINEKNPLLKKLLLESLAHLRLVYTRLST